MDPSSSMAEAEEESRLPEEIERLLGYTFQDPSLLTEALTHGSYDRPSYKRLEFVGDSALGLAVTKFLYSIDPNLDSGLLSALRSANVSNEKLARAAIRHNLYRFLRRNCAALDRAVLAASSSKVSNFTESVTTRGEENAGELSYGGGIRNACKVLADIVESMAGAVYIDCNFDLEVVWQAFRKILEPIINSDNMFEHPVSVLQKLCQKKHGGKTPKYEYFRESSSWMAKAIVDGKIVGTGSSGTKPAARLKAARVALQTLCDMEADVGSAAE
ncbi:ribonuclease 3-like protein 2 [Canna indica]|uniref:Ribonuclease 3-like protein 2 n=1 Tax=Canna indica TaxID=4628 RepID=A0AAQ3QE31_9LILI|nr:ribonuclease 3-like protein 2 [Canna indica]